MDLDADPGPGSWLLPEQERDLVIATEAGDEAACRQLVDAFLPAIGAIARRYDTGGGVERGELIDEGVVGLLRAASRYEPRLNTPFWAYASWWVRQAMQKLVAEVSRPVALSDRALRGLARIAAARRDHIRDHGSDPTTGELAAATGFTAAQLGSLLAIELTPRGIDEGLYADDGSTATFGETVADPHADEDYERVLDGIQMQEVRYLTAALDDRERTVLSGHYGLGQPPQTLREIGEGLGVTPERVRQIEGVALQKLRDAAAQPPGAVTTLT
ncbi:MAG: polymerase, sigma 32 subunit, RpoH [Actinomycetia bacterium]|nr:polymerase, sigma 32 subunit, RpoH [Actinomycetes bacterium]